MYVYMYACMYVCMYVCMPAAVEGSDEQVVPVVRAVFAFASFAFFFEEKFAAACAWDRKFILRQACMYVCIHICIY